jgi:hypothetical protein
MEPEGSSPLSQRISPGSILSVPFDNMLLCYGKKLLAPWPTPKLEDHPLSDVREWLFNIFAATLCTYRPSSLSANWGRATPWWQKPIYRGNEPSGFDCLKDC